MGKMAKMSEKKIIMMMHSHWHGPTQAISTSHYCIICAILSVAIATLVCRAFHFSLSLISHHFRSVPGRLKL